MDDKSQKKSPIELNIGMPELWGGFAFCQRVVASIRNVSPNMYSLIAIGTGAAYLLSLAAIFVPGAFPEVSIRFFCGGHARKKGG